MRAFAALALGLAVPLAGCLDGTPRVHEPEGERIALEPQAFGVRALASFGCGFCGGEVETPQFTAILLGNGGEVVAVDYGHGRGPPNAPTYSPAAAPWAVLLDAIVAAQTLYAEHSGGTQQDRPLHVVSVLAFRMGPGDARIVAAVVDEAREQARTPRFEGDVTDCGRTIVQTFGADKGRAEIRCDHDEGAGWGRLFDQLRALHAWAETGPSV